MRKVCGTVGASSPGSPRPFRVAVLGIVALILVSLPSFGQQLAPRVMSDDVLGLPFPYEAKEVSIEAMLQDLTRKTQVPVISTKPLSGRVTISNQSGTLRDVLEALTDQGQALWWFDGSAIHLEPISSTVSQLIPLQGIRVDLLLSQLRAVGLENPQYPIRAASDAEMIRLVAPQAYVDAVSEVIATMAAARSASGGRSGLPNIIRGRSIQVQ